MATEQELDESARKLASKALDWLHGLFNGTAYVKVQRHTPPGQNPHWRISLGDRRGDL